MVLAGMLSEALTRVTTHEFFALQLLRKRRKRKGAVNLWLFFAPDMRRPASLVQQQRVSLLLMKVSSMLRLSAMQGCAW